jgi:hypothetical protein
LFDDFLGTQKPNYFKEKWIIIYIY